MTFTEMLFVIENWKAVADGYLYFGAQCSLEHYAQPWYRLPTEAEWEYAAKGGKYSRKHPFEYAGSNKLDEVGWYDKNSYGETKVIGLKTPNLLGLYDMSGNVWEWCSDWYAEDFSSTADVSFNLIAPTMVSYRVNRGGSWGHSARYCRSTNRDSYWPTDRGYYVGFRMVLSFSAVQYGKSLEQKRVHFTTKDTKKLAQRSR